MSDPHVRIEHSPCIPQLLQVPGLVDAGALVGLFVNDLDMQIQRISETEKISLGVTNQSLEYNEVEQAYTYVRILP